MNKYLNKIIVVLSLGLGFIFNYVLNLFEHPSVIIIGPAIYLLYDFLFKKLSYNNLIDEYLDSVNFSPLFAIASLIIGGYYYVSNGFENWLSGLFTTVIDLGIIYVLYLVIINVIYSFIYKNESTSSKSSNHSSSSSNSYSSSYTPSYSYDYSSSQNSYNEPKKDTSFSTTYFNNGAKANNVSFGDTLKSYTGISSVSEYKDSYGRYQGKATTYDWGFGFETTVYKDKDGNETKGTTFKF